MKVAVLSEVRFCRAGDGSVWANASPYEFWTRYLDEFEEVAIVGREERASEPHPGMVRVDGPRVGMRGVPHYVGARDLILRWPAVRNAVRPLAWEHDALILRLGSMLALGYPLGALWMWQRMRSGRGREAAVSPAGSFPTSIAVRGGSMKKRPAPALIRNGRLAAPSVAGAVRS